MDLRTVRVDSVDVQVQASHAALVEKGIGDRDAKIVELTKRADELQGKLDGTEKERDELKTKLDEATDPKAVQSAVQARVSLEASARKVLGSEAKLDGLSDREVRVLALGEEFKADGKTDEYINGMFDAAVAAAPVRNDGVDKAKKAIMDGRGVKTDNADPKPQEKFDADDIKRMSVQKAVELGRSPLRATAK